MKLENIELTDDGSDDDTKEETALDEGVACGSIRCPVCGEVWLQATPTDVSVAGTIICPHLRFTQEPMAEEFKFHNGLTNEEFCADFARAYQKLEMGDDQMTAAEILRERDLPIDTCDDFWKQLDLEIADTLLIYKEQLGPGMGTSYRTYFGALLHTTTG